MKKHPFIIIFDIDKTIIGDVAILHQPKRKMRQDYYKNIIILLFIFSIGVNDRI